MADQRVDVIETCNRMAWLADRREWEALADLFTDEVRVDYTSLTGGAPETMQRDELVEGWRASLSGLDATQHLVASHSVELDGERAVCTASFQATHHYSDPHGDPLWILGGHYRYELERRGSAWRIAALTMTATWARGNRNLMNLVATEGEER